MFHQAHPPDGRPHWIMQWVYGQKQTMDGLRGGSSQVWSTQVDRDPISYQIFLQHSHLDLKPIKGYSTFLWSKSPMIHLKTVHDSQSMLSPWCSICLAVCWTDKSQRNVSVSESVGRSGDLSPAGDGDVAMETVDPWSTLWPLNNSWPEKWGFPICTMLNGLSTLCHNGPGVGWWGCSAG